MSELRNAIRDLRNVANTLDTAEFNFEMNALSEFVAGITLDKPPKPPVNILKKLLIKYLRGEKRFLPREIGNLPFIIYEPALSLSNVKKIFSMLDFSRTIHLSRVVRVYLDYYDRSPKTEFLRHELNNLNAVNSPILAKIFSERDKLFSDECLDNTASLFMQKLSVADVLEELSLHNSYKSSSFILASLVNFFRLPTENISAQIKILKEIDSEFDVYRSIFPAIAESLIKSLESLEDPSDKEILTDIFNRRLEDTRLRNNISSILQAL